jgi:hypothetical protein
MRWMVGILKELRRIGGWGSGSPLTRAFAGSGWLAPIFGDGRQVAVASGMKARVPGPPTHVLSAIPLRG